MPMNYESRVSEESKMRSTDRVFVLEVIPGEKAKTNTGMVDPRLFKEGAEGNRLHAIMDTQSSLWYLKYEKGGLPEPLKGMFTSFNKLKDFAERFFINRGVRITEVLGA